MGQPEDAPAVVDERKKLERVTAERARLQELSDVRGARWAVAKRLERDVIDWVLKGGIPGGCQLAEHEDEPISALVKKNERIADAVERYRHRLRELAADLHRVRSSPWPSKDAKTKASEQITALAQAGAPDVDRCVEHGLAVGFNTVVATALVRGTDKPASVSNENVDVMGFVCWALRDQIIARIEQEIDAVADDKAAMDQSQRDLAEEEINNSVLMIERSECALLWHAEANGEVIDFRAGTNVMALLGVRLVTAPAVNPSPGTSEMHAYDIVGGRQR